MGATFYPVFEDGSGGAMEDINGKCLARAADAFDEVCKKAHVPTLYDFFSMERDQMIAELLDGDPEEPASFDESQIPDEHWHSASEGLRTVRVLLDFVRNNGAQLDDADGVREDLEAFERHLVDAEKRNVRWHLAIDA